jgi:hypothetical protein
MELSERERIIARGPNQQVQQPACLTVRQDTSAPTKSGWVITSTRIVQEGTLREQTHQYPNGMQVILKKSLKF